jgi:sucrose phosphorylase
MTTSEDQALAVRAAQDHLIYLYGTEEGRRAWRQLRRRLARFQETAMDARDVRQDPTERLTEQDVFLITYGDQVTEPGRAPLRTLAEVLEGNVLDASAAGGITGLHILPFFPYSSDDGFSVIDYTTVDPELGSWDDIERVGRRFRLMFDAVINHISAESQWFREFLKGNPRYADYFIVVDPGTDLSDVVRPRDKPLLTSVQTAGDRSPAEEKWVWTTFSSDQIDLNYANPDVLLDVIDVLLLYVEKGAEVIRLDAIAYAWKEVGTSSIHLEETHRLVKLIRAVLDIVAPHVILITETNVPHEENVSYFGDGGDEAQMVYQFSLPPLVLHAFHTGDARHLVRWAARLDTPSDSTTFFNFLASHDGVGVRPVEGILSPPEIQALVDRTRRHGGYTSYKSGGKRRPNADSSKSVYELNISYFDALCDPHSDETLDVQVRRFLASQAIMLSLAGVPGIYVHSLFGSRSYHAGVEESGRPRSINRERFRRAELEQALADPTSLRHRVFYPYMDLIRARASHPAFHPRGGQRVLLPHEIGGERSGRALFALVRTAPDGGGDVLCIHNVSSSEQQFRAALSALQSACRSEWEDLISGATHRAEEGRLRLALKPYQVLWLKAVPD